MTTTLVKTEAPWQIEVWNETEKSPDLAVAELAQMYERVGLTALAKRFAVVRQAIGHPLTAEELAVWRWRYPSVYFSPVSHGWNDTQTFREWRLLEWPVPAHVCGLIQHVLETKSFERLEIWTPELRRVPRIGPSPILVGWRNGQAYLLARWAEALEPFEDIAAKARSWRGRWAMRMRKTYLNPGDFFGPLVLVTAVGGVVTFFGLTIATRNTHPLETMAGVGGVVSLAGLLALLFAPFPARMRRIAEWAGWVIR